MQIAVASLERGRTAEISFLRHRGRAKSLPIVLLHGIGSNAQSFAAMMSALPSATDAIAWNAPGYGDSADLEVTSPAPRHYADALERLLDSLGVRRAVVAGHSLGALFAASFAATRPDRVSALILLSPAVGYSIKPGHPLPASVQSRINDITALGPRGLAEARAARLLAEPVSRPEVLDQVREAMTLLRVEGYCRAAHALAAGDLCADAALISAPTLVAVGVADRITPPASARTAYAAFKTGVATYREMADAGHALPQEQPAAVAGLISKFVESASDV